MASDRFVSRGGDKLQTAIENWKLKIENYVVLDVGSSTGGFTDCLLQNGAKKVYALDTAYGELAWKLRNDPRVVVMERTNILHLESLARRLEEASPLGGNASPKQVGRSFADAQDDKVRVDLVTIDAGWTKLELILPIVRNFLKPEGVIIALLKPHYEADKRDLVKGVLSEQKSAEVKDEIIKKIGYLGFKVEVEMESPILGGAGNKEYLLKIFPS